jgi:hypothetical protein
MSRLKAILTATDVPVWLLAVGAIFSLVLTNSVTFWVAREAAQHQTVENAKIADVGEFLKTSNDFENLTRIFMAKVVEKNASDPAAREALLANIQHQHLVLEGTDAYLSTVQREATKRYRSDLVRLSATLQTADDIPSTAPVWRQLNTTLVDRRQVVSALRTAAGLPRVDEAPAGNS